MDNVSLSSHFNSQPHEEADPRTGHAVCRLLVISTHSLTRRLTPHTFRENVIKNNFNSQPHEEADVNLFFAVQAADISTHSLTRRLTTYDSNVIASMPISTHSLTRRLTITQCMDLMKVKHFNSQPHEEADALYPKKPQVHRHFNSQPHEEADCYYHSMIYKVKTFQLTASRGG